MKKIWNIPVIALSCALGAAVLGFSVHNALASNAEAVRTDFTVRAVFVNYDGTTLYETTTYVGGDVTYGGQTPTRPSEDGIDYEFSGWDNPLSDLRRDQLFRAVYDARYQTFTATFVNVDGTYLWSNSVRRGEAPVYGGPTPTYTTIDGVTYTWDGGWDKPLETLTKDTTFVASYNRVDSRHRCTFYDANDAIIRTYFVPDGQSVTGPAMPSTIVYSNKSSESRSVSAYRWDHDLSDIRSDVDFRPVFPTYQDAVIYVSPVNDDEAYYLSAIYDPSEFVAGGVLTLPSSYCGKPIIGVSGLSANSANVQEIVYPEGYEVIDGQYSLNPIRVRLPSTLKRIGSYAFNNMTNLVEVDFPSGSSLEHIDNYAFVNTGLTEFYVPSGVNYIAREAFPNFETFEQDGAEYLRLSPTQTMITQITNLDAALGGGIAQDCIGVHFEQIHNPNGSMRFTTNRSSLSFGDNVRFAEGPILEAAVASSITLNFPASMRYANIGSNYNIRKLNFSGDMDAYCRFNFGGRYCPIPEIYVAGSAVTDVTIPSTLTSIPDSLFYGCDTLQSVALPSGLIEIGSRAFANTPITSITIPSTVKRIGDQAFSSTGLTSVEIPGGIGDGLGNGAFSSCYNLSDLILREGITRIEPETFAGCPITMANLPSTINYLGQASFSSCALNFLGGQQQFLNFENGLISTWGDSGFRYELYFQASPVTTFTLPSSVTSIRPYMFARFINIERINISGRLEYIGSKAFLDCENLTTLSIPNSLRSFTADAFEGCDSLTNLTFASNANFQVIDGDLYNSVGTVLLMVDPNKSGAYSVREGVTDIGDGAFSLAMGINELYVPSSVRMIGSNILPRHEMQRIELSEGLTVLGDTAFGSDTRTCSVQEMNLPASIVSMDNALRNLNVATMTLPRGFGARMSSLYVGSPTVGETHYLGDLETFAKDINVKSDYWFGTLKCLKQDVLENIAWSEVASYPSIRENGLHNASFEGEALVSDSIHSIGGWGLSSCNLRQLSLSGLRYLGEYAFNNCYNLNEVDLRGSSLPYLDRDSFSSCNSLRSVCLNEGIRHIGPNALSYLADGVLVLAPKTLVYVDVQAFYQNTYVLLPNGDFDRSIFDSAATYLEERELTLTFVEYSDSGEGYDMYWNLDADDKPVLHTI